MKSGLQEFDKAFENRIRLQIMSILTIHASYDFLSFKELLDLTDGNLASHLKALERTGYIAVQKSFIGRKPNTKYTATETGKVAFIKHLEVLEAFINNQKV